MSLLFKKEESFVDSVFDVKKLLAGDIPTSKDVSGLELRLSRVRIKDNGTPAVWPFPGLAQLYLLVVVISDHGAMQELTLKGFPKVDDDEELLVDRTLFYWKKSDETPKAPSQIHVLVSVIKSREELREVGKVLTQVKADKNYTDLVGSIKVLVAAATPVTQIADLVFSLA